MRAPRCCFGLLLLFILTPAVSARAADEVLSSATYRQLGGGTAYAGTGCPA
jgi:hypothetical protein